MKDFLSLLLALTAAVLAVLYLKELGSREKERELLVEARDRALEAVADSLERSRSKIDSLAKVAKELERRYSSSRRELSLAFAKAESASVAATAALETNSVDSLKRQVAYLLEVLDKQGTACHEAVHKCDTLIAVRDSALSLRSREVDILREKLEETRRFWLAAERRAQRKVFFGSSCFGLTALPVEGVLRFGLGATLGIGIRF